MEYEVCKDDFEELDRLLLYSGQLLSLLGRENIKKNLDKLTILQLKKKNEFLRNGLADLQKMLKGQTDYGSFE